MKKIFIITGEHSGDKHAADVVREIQQLDDKIQIEAIGGENLASTGIKLFSTHEKMNVVGLSPKILLEHITLARRLIDYLTVYKPDVILMVDYGGFNLGIAGIIKRKLPNTKIYYFIPPQIWASREWRIKRVKKYIDKVFCIFPFEKFLYEKHQIPYEYVGHPLLDELPKGSNKKKFFEKYNLDYQKPLVSIFPGSRVFELKFLLKTFIKSTKLIKKSLPDTQFVIALAPNLREEVLKKYLPKNSDIKIIQNENYALLEISDSLILASGTVALEAALYKTPMLISYKGPWVFYLIYLMVRCIKKVSLPNIIMDREIIKELIQYDSNSEKIANETIKILTYDKYKKNMIKNLSEIRKCFENYTPAKTVAENILKPN